MKERRHNQIEALASDAAWVRALARQLVGDGHLAEDLSQEAFAQALSAERGPRGPLSAWLAGIVRNLAAGTRRSGARRQAREQKAARPELERAAHDPVERLESQRLVTEAVLGLDEPYRSTIIRRYYEGLPPREIARQDGVAAATVNSRMTRALDQLRRRLDRDSAGDRSAWVAVLTPLATSQADAGSLVLGAMTMKKMLAVAAVVGLVGSLVILSKDDAGPSGSAAIAAAGPAKQLAAAPGFEPARDPARAVVPAAGGADARGASLPVLVVDDATLRPVSGAQIIFADVYREQLDSNLWRAHWERRMLKPPRDPREARSSLYPTFTSGADGRTRVPVPGILGARIVAQIGSTGAQARADAGRQEQIELRLVPIRSGAIDVRVLNSAHRPLGGVPVALQHVTQGVGGGDLFTNVSTAVSAGTANTANTANTDGRARLEYGAPAGYPNAIQTAAVALDFPLAERVAVAIPDDLDDWPAEPLTLICPPLGSVIVDVTGPDGEPMPDGTLVSLSPPGEYLNDAGSISRKLVDGQASFWPVGVNAPVKAWAALRWDQDPAGVVAPGPRHEQDTARIHLRLGGRLVEVSGQLRCDDPSAVIEQAFYIQVTDETERLRRPHIIETDGEGRFCLTFAEDGNPPAERSLLFRPVRSAFGQDGRWKEGVTVPLPWIPANGRLDLGEVFLGGQEPLVSGQVVDPSGAPIPDASVGLVTLLHPDQPNDLRCRPQSYTEHTGPEGTFELGGKLPEGALWIRAEVDGPWYHDPVQVFGPTEGLRLVMQPAAVLEGCLRLDPEFPTERLKLQLWADRWGPPAPWFAGQWIMTTPDAEGPPVSG